MALVAHRELELPTRVAAPCYPPGLPLNLASPVYATAVGLVLYGATRIHHQEGTTPNISPVRAFFERVHRILIQVF
jgi:cell division ATPase FtsA